MLLSVLEQIVFKDENAENYLMLQNNTSARKLLLQKGTFMDKSILPASGRGGGRRKFSVPN